MDQFQEEKEVILVLKKQAVKWKLIVTKKMLLRFKKILSFE